MFTFTFLNNHISYALMKSSYKVHMTVLGTQTVLRKGHGAILLILIPGGSTVTYPAVYPTVETLRTITN